MSLAKTKDSEKSEKKKKKKSSIAVQVCTFKTGFYRSWLTFNNQLCGLYCKIFFYEIRQPQGFYKDRNVNTTVHCIFCMKTKSRN